MNILPEIPKDQLDCFKVNVKEWLDADEQIKHNLLETHQIPPLVRCIVVIDGILGRREFFQIVEVPLFDQRLEEVHICLWIRYVAQI